MKTVLVAINAKYIHPNLAVRLLKKNTSYPVDILEFTIKDNLDAIIERISDYDCLAFSVYIWNVEIVKNILTILRKQNKTIILGGPEVSYNAKNYLEADLADYVIKNEGEEAFDRLLAYLNNEEIIGNVPNLYHQGGYTFDRLPDISKIKLAYDLLDDVENKLVYFETSRGCPFNCSYCMASLENKVRFFAIDEIKVALLNLIARKAKTIKFLDRTFNLDIKAFLAIIDLIIAHHLSNQSFQFEITGDILNPSIIDYINDKAPKNLFRFEIGVQSTNVEANILVHRKQDNEKLFANIQRIQAENVIDLHLDLIAGLPNEDYLSFAQTFNDVIALRPHELQLGFLKLLHGTALEKEKDQYGYLFADKAPYEIIHNSVLSEMDIANIHIVEDALEKYYNSFYFPTSIRFILDHERNNFQFFYHLGLYYRKHYTSGLISLFETLDSYISNKEYYFKAHEVIIMDYLTYHKVRPKAWWRESVSKETRNELLRNYFGQGILKDKLIDLYKYAFVVQLESQVMVKMYHPNNQKITIIERKNEL